ncbi:hypothetical protein L3Q82_021616 [Scortum barcoo]|uniref:Uncharacterized protein n=1 Tax=Scortum barcoo TaxID=214431 RepID=A0ACB8X862_9TELE|nr:hypothetical protein L3Q82_021616 [Scortum barcoo]
MERVSSCHGDGSGLIHTFLPLSLFKSPARALNRGKEAVKQTGGPVCSRQRAAETSSKMEVVKQREAPSVNMQTERERGKDREAVREEDREKRG